MSDGRLLLAGIAVALLGVALGTDAAVSRERAFQGDEATYYAMALSLAHDGDIEHARGDLARVYAEYPSGPLGVFLKRDVDGTVSYAKGYAVPLLAAPLVRLFGSRGFLVLHALLLAACIAVGSRWLARDGPLEPRHVATAATVLGATVIPVYLRWMTTEIASFALAFLGTALWFRPPFTRGAPTAGAARWLGTEPREIAAAAVIGLAAFVKLLPNAFLMLPLGLACLARRRLLGAVSVSVSFFAVLIGLFGVNILVTGEWNYQGGDRWTCYFQYPPDVDFAPPFCTPMATETEEDAAGAGSTLETAGPREWLTTWPPYLWGRFGGALWYFVPLAVCVGSWLRRSRDPWRGLLFATLLVQAGVAIYMIPFNYVGGGGAIGSRYFLGSYGIVLFLLAAPLTARALVVTWAAAGLLLGATLLAPLTVTRTPGMQAMGFPWRALPPERNLLLDLPTNTNPHAYGKRFPEEHPRYRLYFLDQSFGRRETGCDWVGRPEASEIGCWWTRGASTNELLVQTDEPVERIRVAILNGGRPNTVTVRVQGRAQRVELAPAASTELLFEAGPSFVYDHKGTRGTIYHASVTSAAGWVPALDSASGREGDERFLGVFVHLDVEPVPSSPGRSEADDP